jgi:formyltetrahydrofolate deformylase
MLEMGGTTMSQKIILKLSCADRPGIVAAVSSFLLEQGCNIVESAQFEDSLSTNFFMRMVFLTSEVTPDMDGLRQAFGAIGKRFSMNWSLKDAARPMKTMIMVSKFDHCLIDLLYRYRIGQLPIDITAIVSNHAYDDQARQSFGAIPFHHLPVTQDTKPQQESQLRALIDSTGTELVVLARYMQILSDQMCAFLDGRAINIHHSFLPSFKGAKPYHQAHARGVKLIGATAHYVTQDLDEGPIIEQAVERVDHRAGPDELVALGRDTEKVALARAVQFHTEDRVLLNGRRTVVFR